MQGGSLRNTLCFFYAEIELSLVISCKELKERKRLKVQDRKEAADGSRSQRRWESMRSRAQVAGLESRFVTEKRGKV